MDASGTLIAVMGGTFDPVHIGHLRAAYEAACALRAQVRLMPAQVPPHRPQPKASATQRLRMLEIATQGIAEFKVDARELKRSGPSFSVDTLIEMRAEVGDQQPIALIVGADAFAGLPSWNRWLRLFDLAHIVVLTRPGAATSADWSAELRAQVEWRRCVSAEELHNTAAGKVFALGITPLAISATAVRESFARGEVPHWLVPREVLEFIVLEGLYPCAPMISATLAPYV
jgi:nicotinate-nucleotide adenylyltransferase